MAAITHRLRCEILEARRLTAIDVADGLNVSVGSEGIAGLRAAEIRLNYDPRALSLQEHDIRVGKAWDGTAGLVTKVDEAVGSVNIFLFSAEPMAADGGPLVDVRFQVVDELVADVAMATLARFQLNEGAIESSAIFTPQVSSSSLETTETTFEIVLPVEQVAELVPEVVEPLAIVPVAVMVESPAAVVADMPQSVGDTKACSGWDGPISSESLVSDDYLEPVAGPLVGPSEPAAAEATLAFDLDASAAERAAPPVDMRSVWLVDGE